MRLSVTQARALGFHGGTRQKYGAVKSGQFDSRHESRVYGELRLRELAGEIRDLRPHPVFLLFAGGKFVGKFTPDACFRNLADELVVVEAKQPHTRTEAYMLRRRMLKAIYGLQIVEIL